MNVYEELERKVLPKLEDFKTDLTKHDRECIERNPGTPFLHYTRSTGTIMVMLHASDSEAFPAEGEYVPYLFGTADREHILDETWRMAQYCADRKEDCLYFDGRSLKELSSADSVRIALDYGRKVRNAWRTAKARV